MKNIFTFLIITLSLTSNAQDIIGLWKTFDDKTKEKKSVIEIYKEDDLYFAKITEIFSGDKNAICNTCNGIKKGQPIIGLVIIENLKKDKNEFNEGSILDPENGKTYSCYLKLIKNNKLKVRGFLGISIFGRTQYWIRKE